MLPLTPHQKLSQNKIAGLSIAWGRAAWAQLEDGSYGYVFPEGALQLASTLADFEEKGLTLDALMACLDQFEAELGSALDTRQRYGMLRNHGYACPGLVVRSEDDDRVVCVMTPASWEYEATEAYFEWFFDEKYTTVSTFDTLAGVGEEMVDDAPLDVPYYESACEVVAGLDLSESRKQNFLQRVWDYHKNTMPGLKPAAKKAIVAEWKGYLSEQFSKQGEGCKNYDKEQDVCLDKDIAEPANEEDEGDEVTESNDAIAKNVMRIYDMGMESDWDMAAIDDVIEKYLPQGSVDGTLDVQINSLSPADASALWREVSKVKDTLDDRQEMLDDIEPGDYVDFGAYGKLYILSMDAGRRDRPRAWATDQEKDRFKPDASGWYINISQAEDVIEKGSDADPSDYEDEDEDLDESVKKKTA